MRSKKIYKVLCLPSLVLLPACTTTASHVTPRTAELSRSAPQTTYNMQSNARVAVERNAPFAALENTQVSQISSTAEQHRFGLQSASSEHARSLVPTNPQIVENSVRLGQNNQSRLATSSRRPQHTGFAMGLGASDDAPVGLEDFCSRSPAYCTIASTTSQRQSRPNYEHSGFMLTSMSAGRSTIYQPVETNFEVGRQQIRPIVWSSQTRQAVMRVNRQINSAMVGTTDRLAFGRDEYWTMPLSQPDRPRGRNRPLADCEDFALEKRQALISAGIPETALYLAVAATERIGLHAVLVISTDEGDFVLDNLTDWVLPWSDTQYVWIKRQSTTSMLDWVMAGEKTLPNDPEAPPRLFDNNPFVLARSGDLAAPASETPQAEIMATLNPELLAPRSEKSVRSHVAIGLRGFAQDSASTYVPANQATSLVVSTKLVTKSLQLKVPTIALRATPQKVAINKYHFVDSKQTQNASKIADMGTQDLSKSKKADNWTLGKNTLVWDFQ
jgi:predicted transglutaminase-like cysteine proteinase